MMKNLSVVIWVLVGLQCFGNSIGKAIRPVEDPYVFRHEIIYDASTNSKLVVTYMEDGLCRISIQLGRWAESYAADIPVLAVMISTNILTEYVYIDYAIGLNMDYVTAILTGNSDLDVKYYFRNWIPLGTDQIAFGAFMQGEKFNIQTFGGLLHLFGVTTNVEIDDKLSLSGIAIDY